MDLAALIQRAIKEIAVAIKNMNMYTPKHPMAKKTVEKTSRQKS